MTPIDKIRAQVEEVRREHYQVAGLFPPSCSCGGTAKVIEIDEEGGVHGLSWPCPTLRMAEDVLELAEALTMLLGSIPGSIGAACARAERVLAEVAR